MSSFHIKKNLGRDQKKTKFTIVNHGRRKIK